MVYREKGFTIGAMNGIAEIFAQNIILFRKRKGLSQYDLAAITKISRTMISHYERDGIIPQASKLEVLAKALEIPVYRMFMGEAAKDQNDSDISDIDPRSVKKLRDILSLPAEDRNDLYRILNKMLRKNQLERQIGNSSMSRSRAKGS
jgi:transcriptional regulator with XRE-family HTH domain